jgi:O-antigen/teichoic acid export membrane protein
VYWGNLLFVTIASGLAATGIVTAVSRWLLPSSVPLLVIVFVSIAELLFARLVDCAAMAFQAVERLDVTANILVWSACFRLLGIGALRVLVREPAATHWAFVYLLTTMLGTALSLCWVHFRIGSPRLALGAIKNEFVEGLSFALSLSSQSVYNDIDKSMLARMATLDAVGIYAAAYRIVDVAFVPVRSLLAAAYPGFFRAGAEGFPAALAYLRRLLPNAVKYSLLAFFCMVVGAPLVQYVFGADFARTAIALRWLALLPLLKTTHYLFADTLTCTGHQRLRSGIQALVAVFNVLINLWIIPAYSWRGAAWSSVACDGLLVLLMYAALKTVSAVAVRPLTANSSAA